jgi:hypothetical protein
MNLKQLLVGTMLLSSIMTPIASSQAEAIMERFDVGQHILFAELTTGAAVGGVSASGVGLLAGEGAATGVSVLTSIFLSGSLLYYYDKEVENDLLELAMGEEVDSALLAEFLENVRNQSEEVEGKTGVNIDDLSDQELAAFLVSPLE